MGIYIRIKILREFEKMDRSNFQNKNVNKFIALGPNKRTLRYPITT